MKPSLRTATQQPVFRAPESDAGCASEQARIRDSVKAKKSDLRNGLTRRQRTFVLEKLVGLNDKDDARQATNAVIGMMGADIHIPELEVPSWAGTGGGFVNW